MSSKLIFGEMRKNDAGVTLVELLAAIAILSIVVTAFLAFFIQAAETNNRTNKLNEATFLAQEEMELITSYSTDDYSAQEVKDRFFSGEIYPKNSNGYVIEAVLTEPTNDNKLYKVIVTVSEGGKSRAKMETRLPFETQSE
ncbi:MAG: prepilin-type N-terminal cleavage/methylation domain-containing protein [Tetragenococcus halophilus]|nr:prepilin-type N-terminal cleavage/methylation domain-containing protein [Tetragenococcus halophilus]